MKVTGVIAEYNPFHNGHKYHLEKAREMTGADYVVVVMSGDHTQRGTPAIYSKYMRARTALFAGADLVLEMPVFGSVASAPDFAECGVMTLNAIGVCDALFFGSESGDIEDLKMQALSLSDESEAISEKIKEGLKQGLTWPDARAKAYAEIGQVPSLPNDILGIEYIRAIHNHNVNMEPVTMKRTDPGYHSEERCGQFASATAARKAILNHEYDFLHEVLPEEFFRCLSDGPNPPLTFDDYSLLVNEKLLTASMDEYINVSSMPEDLARKLYKNKTEFLPADVLVAARKDRNYTYTRVNRAILNLTLGITKDDTALFKQSSSAPWIRILGFRKNAAPLLSELKKNAKAPVIAKTANAAEILPEPLLPLFQKHIQSAERYRMVAQFKCGQTLKNDFTHPIIII